MGKSGKYKNNDCNYFFSFLYYSLMIQLIRCCYFLFCHDAIAISYFVLMMRFLSVLMDMRKIWWRMGSDLSERIWWRQKKANKKVQFKIGLSKLNSLVNPNNLRIQDMEL